MLEFYQAYSDYRDLMDLTDELLASVALLLCGNTTVPFGEHMLDFGRIERLTMHEAIVRHWPPGPAPALTVDACK